MIIYWHEGYTLWPDARSSWCMCVFVHMGVFCSFEQFCFSGIVVNKCIAKSTTLCNESKSMQSPSVSWAKFRVQQWCLQQLLSTMCATERAKHNSLQCPSTLRSVLFCYPLSTEENHHFYMYLSPFHALTVSPFLLPFSLLVSVRIWDKKKGKESCRDTFRFLPFSCFCPQQGHT